MKTMLTAGLALSATMLTPIAASAQTEIQFWHAFTGRLGELVAAQVEDFNASQSDIVVEGISSPDFQKQLTSLSASISRRSVAIKALCCSEVCALAELISA